MPPRAAFITRYVDPLERLSEFLFGLIIVLSFTLDAGLVVGEGEQATRQMLLAIVGCNIAWGLLLGISLGRLALSGYVFNPDLADPTWVLSISLDL